MLTQLRCVLFLRVFERRQVVSVASLKFSRGKTHVRFLPMGGCYDSLIDDVFCQAFFG